LQGVRQNIHYRFIAHDPAPKTLQKCRYFLSACCARFLPERKGPLIPSQQSFFTFLQHLKRSARHYWLCLFSMFQDEMRRIAALPFMQHFFW
jgi:hypothetical protein